MSRNSSGEYTLPAGNPVVPDTEIESDWANTTLEDVAEALTQSIATTGVSLVEANIPLNNFKLIQLGAGSVRSDATNLGQVQDNSINKVSLSLGTNAMVGTMLGTLPTTLPNGFKINFFVIAPAPTGATTITINGRAPMSLVQPSGAAISSGYLVVGDYVEAVVSGSAFKITTVSSSGGVSSSYEQASITGWSRRVSPATYPQLSIVDGTHISVPAGSGYLTTAGDGSTTTQVSWSANANLAITNVATDFTTTIAVDSGGNIVQFAGRLGVSTYRTHIILGVVEHLAGTVAHVSTNPIIFSDDGYRALDLTYPMVNILTSGGKVSKSVDNNMRIGNTIGYIAVPGASSDTVNQPNQLTMAANSTITFRALAGTSTLGSPITTCPIGSYDNAGAVTALGAGQATIHRLYYLWGAFVWVYGQFVYVDKEEALANLLLDRSKYVPSSKLSDATLICEIIAEEGITTMDDAYFINRTSADPNIGAVAGLADAPSDGQVYGRKNGAWFPSAGSSVFAADVEVVKSEPLVILENIDDANVAGLQVKAASGYKIFGIETDIGNDVVNFVSYDPTNGNFRNQSTLNLATGTWILGNIATPVASASTVDLGAVEGQYVEVTGTTTITSFGTADAADSRTVMFSDVLTLTHSANLILPGGANVVTKANDIATFVSMGAGVWRCVNYQQYTKLESVLDTEGQIFYPNGLIEKWGIADRVGNTTTVTFPTAFPTACFNVQVCPAASNVSGGFDNAPGVDYDNLSASQFTFGCGSGVGKVFWRALGK